MIVDTNVLLRYFMRDGGTKALEAKEIIEKQQDIYIDDFVVFETVFVLIRDYQKSRKQSCEVMGYLLERDNIVYESGLASVYLRLFYEENLDFADCYLISLAIKKDQLLKTFDKKMQKVYEQELANC